MRPVRPTSWRPVAGALSLTGAAALALLSVSSLPVGAQTAPTNSTQDCLVLQLGNPNPGDLLTPGGYVVSGVAYDPAAVQGAGIQRVDLFLGERDQGGTILGSATPGDSASGNARAFQVQITIPDIIRHDDFVAYAYSAINSAQTSVAIPVNLGAAPTPTPVSNPIPVSPVQLTDTVQTQCASGARAAPLPGIGLVVPAQAPVLNLSNPGPGDLLNLGGYVVSGLAYDPAAPQGQSGVDRVDLFLDDRDQGGTPLSSTVPGLTTSNPRGFQVEITIPTHVNGPHTFFAYTRSSMTGLETVTSVPVFVGVPPTPTPRPS
jgi:hypothetical protein